MDSLVLCKFVRGVFQDFYTETAKILSTVTGWEMTSAELKRVGQRVVNARKCLNQREGWTRAEDTLPDRLLGTGPDTPDSTQLTKPRLEAMIAAYYSARGWDGAGRVAAELREALSLGGPEFGA
jgi:aldehyde:ferredoxin oxidoreductase